MKHIKTFEGLFTKDQRPESVPFEIERILQELKTQKPPVHKYEKGPHLEFGDNNRYIVYETKFKIDGEDINIVVEDAVYIPFIRPIVQINYYQYNTGKNKELLKTMKELLVNSQPV